MEGVRCRGYGLIPKAVMLDPGLSASAKGLYAFFASFTGSGNTAFPGRDTILHALGLCKDAYYRHLQELTGLDYIRIQKRKLQGRYDGNLYILVEKPARYQEIVPVVGAEDSIRIKAEGLLGGGFGFIPKAVMLDAGISVKAKALYAYLSSFCGAGETACPGKDLILYHLGMGKDAYAAALKALRQANYVTVCQKHSGGKLGNLEFTLVNKPDLLAAQLGAAPIQVPEKQDTEIQSPEESDVVYVLPGKQDKAPLYPEIQDTAQEDTDFPYPNTTSVTNNSLRQYQLHQQQSLPTGDPWDEEEEGNDSTYVESLYDIAGELYGSERKAREIVQYLCNYSAAQDPAVFGTADFAVRSRDFYFMFVDAMIALLSDPVTELGKDKIPHGRIIWQLSRHLPRLRPGALLSFCWQVEQEYEEAVRRTEPRFPRLFLKRMILNRLTEGDMRIHGEAMYDLANYPGLARSDRSY